VVQAALAHANDDDSVGLAHSEIILAASWSS